MKRALQLFLLLLLMAALPLQGAAAAMRLSCSAHHSPASAAAMHPSGAMPHAGAHSALRTTTAHIASTAKAAATPDAHASCSAGAVCCIAAAPPPASLPATIGNGTKAVTAVAIVLPADFIPSGLERPPRRVFA